MAVAHHRLTGEDNALDAAKRFADHIDRVFGPNRWYDGATTRRWNWPWSSCTSPPAKVAIWNCRSSFSMLAQLPRWKPLGLDKLFREGRPLRPHEAGLTCARRCSRPLTQALGRGAPFVWATDHPTKVACSLDARARRAISPTRATMVPTWVAFVAMCAKPFPPNWTRTRPPRAVPSPTFHVGSHAEPFSEGYNRGSVSEKTVWC